MNKNTNIICSYNFGFFANCGALLNFIIRFCITKKNIPDTIDCSKGFLLYNSTKNDIFNDYFENYKNKYVNINFRDTFDVPDFRYQYLDYTKIDYKYISPFIEKFFSPSKKVIDIKQYLLDKYNINTNEYIGLYYRGTDKITETPIANYQIFENKLKCILDKNKNLKVLVITDTKPFLEYFKTKFDNLTIIDEIKVSDTNKGVHNENSTEDNYNEMFYLFASFLIIAQCNYIICGSGNCSIWMMYFRGNGNNVYQYFQKSFLH